MSLLHRLQWIDAQIRAELYPNTRRLAEEFEISRRQALRDFDYLRDSLGAPLEYSALRRGYYYAEDGFTLPGLFVTPVQRDLLNHLASYYQSAASGDHQIFREMASLFQRLSHSGHGRPVGREPRRSAAWVPFDAVLEFPEGLRGDHCPSVLEPYWRGGDSGGRILCEFQASRPFLAALAATGKPLRVIRPDWLRRRFHHYLETTMNLNMDSAGVTRHVTPPLVPFSWDRSPEPGRRMTMSRSEPRRATVDARWTPCWHSYGGAAYGVLTAADLVDMPLSHFLCMTGTAFRLIVHEQCCVSAPITYPWWSDHMVGLDRMGVHSDVTHIMPGSFTYEAARKWAIRRIRNSIDRGIGVILWGVDTGEFGVVHGYDDHDGVLLVSGVAGHGLQGSDPIRYENVGRSFPDEPILHYQIPLERVPVNPEQTYRISLEYYVNQMERPVQITPAYHSGLEGYAVWKRALTAGAYQSFGLRYMVYVYAEMKDHGSRYARSLAVNWDGIPGLAEIAALFEQIAARYQGMNAVLGQQATDGPEHLRTDVTREQASSLLPLVSEAADLERQAVSLVKMGLGHVSSIGDSVTVNPSVTLSPWS